MAIPPLNHRDPWFGPWLVQLQADTRVIYNTDQARPCNLNHASLLGTGSHSDVMC